ncbi:MAG: acetate kinase [Thermodesulfobacteriota bacterium]
MKVAIINCGSSSIKYAVFDMTSRDQLGSGLLERIGGQESCLRHRRRNEHGSYDEILMHEPIANHVEGFEFILGAAARMRILEDPGELSGIGHRVVHGGELYDRPVVIDLQVVEKIRELIPLAPLHNPANIEGIEVAMARLPAVPQVAVFDTSFHATIPPAAFHYALPYRFYEEQHVRRYGFHGNSHHYVAKRAAALLGKPLEGLNLITLHLGNGASAAAIRGGRSIDTSMGMTPLEGLMMGTRCGDLDPAIHGYLHRATGMPLEEVEKVLNSQSGLKGICGSNDMREAGRLADAGDPRARLALDMYCYRLRKYIGAYFAALGRVDAIVFTGGIGENSGRIRAGACAGLSGLGIELDQGKNDGASGRETETQSQRSAVKILVIPTNEELEIAGHTVEAIRAWQEGRPR